MPQDASFNVTGMPVSNSQPVQTPSLTIPNDPLMIPQSQPLPDSQPVQPQAPIAPAVSPVVQSPVNTHQSLPDITAFVSDSISSPVADPINSPAVAQATAPTPSPVADTTQLQMNKLSEPVSAPDPNPVTVPQISVPEAIPVTSPEQTQPATDFRAIAEALITQTGPTDTTQTPPVNTPVSPVVDTTQAASPSIQPEPFSGIQAPQATPANTKLEQLEPQLESDPFIQEVHEQDVKVEREALETLINSNRIDPELKEHLKIELLKFKDIATDVAPIGQDLNTLASEVMTPEPATPITNPVQKLPPELPM